MYAKSAVVNYKNLTGEKAVFLSRKRRIEENQVCITCEWTDSKIFIQASTSFHKP